MRLVEHPHVWTAIIEGDTLVAWTALDLSADYPEDNDRAYMLSKAAVNELRQRHYSQVRVIDCQPCRWPAAAR